MAWMALDCVSKSCDIFKDYKMKIQGNLSGRQALTLVLASFGDARKMRPFTVESTNSGPVKLGEMATVW